MSNVRRVVKWIDYDDAGDHEDSRIGGLGGWFGHSHTWADYLNMFEPGAIPYLLAMQAAVTRDGIREGGDWHQDCGVPLFDDGTVATYSYRAWGDLLAAIWSEHDGVSYSYMNFYMGAGPRAPKTTGSDT